jgi:hypothetical protein
LSTALLRGDARDGSDSALPASTIIHTPVENAKDSDQPLERHADADKLPGEFVSDELEAQTKRFLEEVKGLARRRREAVEQDQPGPPPPDRSQRSRRR